jgi:hypothetical protein
MLTPGATTTTGAPQKHVSMPARPVAKSQERSSYIQPKMIYYNSQHLGSRVETFTQPTLTDALYLSTGLRVLTVCSRHPSVKSRTRNPRLPTSLLAYVY